MDVRVCRRQGLRSREFVHVTVGPTEADQTVITGGLANDELVVVDGIDKLRPGTKVAVREQCRPVAKAELARTARAAAERTAAGKTVHAGT